jgi:nucleotide-binding universal stress UspA family protein
MALKPRSLLIASDFSEASEKALPPSLALAQFYGSKFCLAHVVSSLGLTMAGPSAIAVCEEAVLREAAQLEASLVRTGALSGVQHKFVVRRGALWPELREIIREEGTDLLVVGTHGRHGMAKLFFGSVAEQIFRQADCPVLIFGPHSKPHSWIGTPARGRTFLFATNFGQASAQGLAQAIAVATDFEAKLAFLNVVPTDPLRQDQSKLRQDAHQRSLQRLAQLARDANLDITLECHLQVDSKQSTGELILETAERLRADLIIMVLHDSAHAGVISHLTCATAYDVVCHAGSPVLTVNHPSRNVGIPPTLTEGTGSPLSRLT